jgi:hypothetical protein
MELLDRYLLRVTLVLALTIYAVASGEVSVVASPSQASIIAAVQHTPIVVGLRLELLRGCLTLAVRAQLSQEHGGHALRQDSAGGSLSIDESTPYSLLCRLAGMPSRQHID